MEQGNKVTSRNTIGRSSSVRKSWMEDPNLRLDQVGEELSRILYLVEEDRRIRSEDALQLHNLIDRALFPENVYVSIPARSRTASFINAEAGTHSEKLDRLGADANRVKKLPHIRQDKEQVNSIEELKNKWETVVTVLERDYDKLKNRADGDRRAFQLDLEELRKAYNDERTKREQLSKQIANQTVSESKDYSSKQLSNEVQQLKQKLQLVEIQNLTLQQSVAFYQMNSSPAGSLRKSSSQTNSPVIRRRNTLQGTLGDDLNVITTSSEMEDRDETLKKYKKSKKKLKNKTREVEELKKQMEELKKYCSKSKLKDFESAVLQHTLSSKKLLTAKSTGSIRIKTDSF